MRDETVVINLVGLDFYDLTLGQPLVEDCVVALILVQFFAKIALIFVQFLTLQKISNLIIISGIYLKMKIPLIIQ